VVLREDRDFDNVTMSFEFCPNRAIEPASILQLKQRGWPVNKTSLLLFARTVTDESFAPCMSQDFHKWASEIKFMVENSAIEVVQEQCQRIKKYVTTVVDPQTAEGAMQEYRQKKEQNGGVPTARSVRDGKAQSQSCLNEFETIHDTFLEYIRGMRNEPEKFGWSLKVRDHLNLIEKEMKNLLMKLRKSKNDFWNKEDGKAAQGLEQENRKNKREMDNLHKKQEQEKAEKRMLEEAFEKSQEDARMARAEWEKAQLEIRKLQDLLEQSKKETEELLNKSEMDGARWYGEVEVGERGFVKKVAKADVERGV